MIHAYCDGSIRGSHWAKAADKASLPHAWSGYVIKTPAGEYVHHHSVDWGENEAFSGNTAEYGAVFLALKWLLQHRPGEAVTVFSDSQLIINQMSGRFQCHNAQLVKLRDGCRALAAKLPLVRYQWIPRERNAVADRISKALQVKFEGRPLAAEEVKTLLSKA